MAEPVFYDPRRARWKRLRRSFDVVAVLVSALIIFFVYTALRDEPLPELLFSPQKRAFKALKESEKDRARERQKQACCTLSSQVKAGGFAGQTEPGGRDSRRLLRALGRSQFLLTARLCPPDRHSLSRLAPRSQPDGRLQGVDDQTNKFFDVVQGSAVRSVDDRVMPFLKTEDPSMEVFPMVNNFDGANWYADIVGFPEQSGFAFALPPPGRAIPFVGALSRPHDRLRSLSAQRTAWLRRVSEGAFRRSACSRT